MGFIRIVHCKENQSREDIFLNIDDILSIRKSHHHAELYHLETSSKAYECEILSKNGRNIEEPLTLLKNLNKDDNLTLLKLLNKSENS